MADIKAYEPGPPGDDEQGPRPYDAETIEATPVGQGMPVDPPGKTTFADILGRADERRPVVPASLRSRAGRRSLVILAAGFVTHGALFHLTHSPVYAGRAVLYSPRGAWRMLARAVWWARAEEGNWELRRRAAASGDSATWIQLDARRMQQSRPRWFALAAGLLALVAAGLIGYFIAPAWAKAAAALLLVLTLARVGRPVDRPIIDRAFNAARYVRLTAELTRQALIASGAGIKEPSAVKFNREIYRDGPGYTAEVSLPTGIIATDVIDRRDYLAAGFQLPVAQVWPEPVKGAHPGVLAVWVGDRPVDRMRPPKSPLLTCGKLDFFGQMPWGHDVRMRPVPWRLGGRNSLFGGMPNTGKTVASRNVGLAASFDPLVRFAISELKGSGDYDPLEVLCADGLYISGSDEGSKVRTLEILRWMDDECDRRGPRIRVLATKGLNTENSLNRAIAEADESLFPLLGIFDEIQELITDPEYGKEAKALLTSLMKKGRFAGIHFILGTQRIDKESVPRGISSNVSNRMCLGVTSHVETDLVLGTGAYKRGARPTNFVPPADGDNPWAGWGYLAGRDQPVQPDYIDVPTARGVVARAMALRGGPGVVDLRRDPDRDVLADVVKVFAHTGRPGLQWQRLAELLAEAKPQLYGALTAEAVSAMVRAEEVPSVDVKADGVALKGCRRSDVEAAMQRRAISG
jgi:S-DNA-T family DNA segregation ATPase FtsK/SpoIIIE